MEMERVNSGRKLGGRESVSRRASPPAFKHDVQFYESDLFLVNAVCDYLTPSADSQQICVAIATQRHRIAIARTLARKGVNVARLQRSGHLNLIDADKTLASFMTGDSIDAARFRDHVGGLFTGLRVHSSRLPIRAFGEMVDVLWQRGNQLGALQLEALWNESGSQWNIELMCGYRMANFADSSHAARFEEICGEHVHVAPAESYSSSNQTERQLEIARLQQRAQALEHEVSKRKELEKELREALNEQERALVAERTARADAESANRAKDQFLAVMSHELRTPLNAIAGHTQLLELGLHGPVTTAQRDALDRIDRSQRHLLALVNDVLNLSRVASGRAEYSIETVDIAPLVRSIIGMVEPLLASAQLRCEVIDHSCATMPIRVLADRERLQQIVLNLLTNAIKFTPPGGLITVEYAAAEHSASGYVQVSDTGIGIAPERIEEVFEPFVQLATKLSNRQDGIGLGLTISREFARGMRGDLTVEKGRAHGSAFRLTLPCPESPV